MAEHQRDIISWDTNLDLCNAAERYCQTVRVPQFVSVGQFAIALTGVQVVEPQTLISGDQESLAVAVTGIGIEETFATIQLSPSIAADLTMFGASDHERANPIRRRLTEPEGRALVADIQAIITALHKETP